MLALVAAAISFGVLAGLIAWQANLATYNNYHKIVDVGSVSVDSALRARAAVLDHMSAAATFLETTGDNQKAAQERATAALGRLQQRSAHLVAQPERHHLR